VIDKIMESMIEDNYLYTKEDIERFISMLEDFKYEYFEEGE